MKVQFLSIRNAIIAMSAIFVLGLAYIIFSGMGEPDSGGGALAGYATGDMSTMVQRIDAPDQPADIYINGAGEEVRLSDYRGKVLLVNLWASWCAPCVAEMPSLDALQAEFGGEDFEVVTISLDRSIEEARRFFDENDLENLPLIHDAGFTSLSALGGPGLPISVIYDRSGREIGFLPGEADWHGEDARRLVQAAINGAR